MKRKLSRRDLLIAGASFPAGLAIGHFDSVSRFLHRLRPAPATVRYPSLEEGLAALARRFCSGWDEAPGLAREFARAHPETNDRSKLVRSILYPMDWPEPGHAEPVEEYRLIDLVRSASRNDYRDGRVELVLGHFISLTELRLLALGALQSG